MVAMQVRDVPDAVRLALVREAESRGQSLQMFLLDVLEREASNARNRDFLRSYRGPFADGRRARVDIEAALRTDRSRDGG